MPAVGQVQRNIRHSSVPPCEAEIQSSHGIPSTPPRSSPDFSKGRGDAPDRTVAGHGTILCGSVHLFFTRFAKKRMCPSALRGPTVTPVGVSNTLGKFDPKTFLSAINGGRRIVAFPKKQIIFGQGDSSDAVFHPQKGKVKLTVVSKSGKETTIGVLNEGDFFGEDCLTGQLLRLCAATAMTDCSVMEIEKKSMMEVLQREQTCSDLFVKCLLARNIRYEEDLADLLFNSSEKRLAEILLWLAHFGEEGKPETVVPKMSQESLAEMVGTTRPRVRAF
jgi:CRP/FNR family transcriptional regulator, cyclic AMP receptor protein